MAFNPLTPSFFVQDINTFLVFLQIPRWRIHPKLVEYNDAADCKWKITLLINKKKTEDPDVDSGVLEWYREDMSAGDTIANSITSMRQSSSIAMLCGDWQKDLAQEMPLGTNFQHVILVFLKNRQVSTSIFAFFSLLMWKTVCYLWSRLDTTSAQPRSKKPTYSLEGLPIYHQSTKFLQQAAQAQQHWAHCYRGWWKSRHGVHEYVCWVVGAHGSGRRKCIEFVLGSRDNAPIAMYIRRIAAVRS